MNPTGADQHGGDATAVDGTQQPTSTPPTPDELSSMRTHWASRDISPSASSSPLCTRCHAPNATPRVLMMSVASLLQDESVLLCRACHKTMSKELRQGQITTKDKARKPKATSQKDEKQGASDAAATPPPAAKRRGRKSKSAANTSSSILAAASDIAASGGAADHDDEQSGSARRVSSRPRRPKIGRDASDDEVAVEAGRQKNLAKVAARQAKLAEDEKKWRASLDEIQQKQDAGQLTVAEHAKLRRRKQTRRYEDEMEDAEAMKKPRKRRATKQDAATDNGDGAKADPSTTTRRASHRQTKLPLRFVERDENEEKEKEHGAGTPAKKQKKVSVKKEKATHATKAAASKQPSAKKSSSHVDDAEDASADDDDDDESANDPASWGLTEEDLRCERFQGLDYSEIAWAKMCDAWYADIRNMGAIMNLQHNLSMILHKLHWHMDQSVESYARPVAPVRVAIVGAGVAGLVAAHQLATRGFHVTIVEARNRKGGRILTWRLPEPEPLMSKRAAAAAKAAASSQAATASVAASSTPATPASLPVVPSSSRPSVSPPPASAPTYPVDLGAAFIHGCDPDELNPVYEYLRQKRTHLVTKYDSHDAFYLPWYLRKNGGHAHRHATLIRRAKVESAWDRYEIIDQLMLDYSELLHAQGKKAMHAPKKRPSRSKQRHESRQKRAPRTPIKQECHTNDVTGSALETDQEEPASQSAVKQEPTDSSIAPSSADAGPMDTSDTNHTVANPPTVENGSHDEAMNENSDEDDDEDGSSSSSDSGLSIDSDLDLDVAFRLAVEQLDEREEEQRAAAAAAVNHGGSSPVPNANANAAPRPAKMDELDKQMLDLIKVTQHAYCAEMHELSLKDLRDSYWHGVLGGDYKVVSPGPDQHGYTALVKALEDELAHLPNVTFKLNTEVNKIEWGLTDNAEGLKIFRTDQSSATTTDSQESRRSPSSTREFTLPRRWLEEYIESKRVAAASAEEKSTMESSHAQAQGAMLDGAPSMSEAASSSHDTSTAHNGSTPDGSVPPSTDAVSVNDAVPGVPANAPIAATSPSTPASVPVPSPVDVAPLEDSPSFAASYAPFSGTPRDKDDVSDRVGVRLHMEEVSYDDETRQLQRSHQHSTLEAEFVLATASLGVLQSDLIKFDPPLPAWKHRAIMSLGMGCENKVVLQFPSCFWPPHFHYLRMVEEHRYKFLNLHAFGVKNVLVAQTPPPYSRRLSQDDEEVVKEVVDTLKEMYGSHVVPAPLRYRVTRWHEDPYARGSYSFIKRGSSADMIRDYFRPVNGNLFFAGEGSHPTDGQTIHGAWMSAVKAAQLMTTSARKLPSTRFSHIGADPDRKLVLRRSQYMAMLHAESGESAGAADAATTVAIVEGSNVASYQTGVNAEADELALQQADTQAKEIQRRKREQRKNQRGSKDPSNLQMLQWYTNERAQELDELKNAKKGQTLSDLMVFRHQHKHTSQPHSTSITEESNENDNDALDDDAAEQIFAMEGANDADDDSDDDDDWMDEGEGEGEKDEDRDVKPRSASSHPRRRKRSTPAGAAAAEVPNPSLSGSDHATIAQEGRSHPPKAKRSKYATDEERRAAHIASARKSREKEKRQAQEQ